MNAVQYATNLVEAELAKVSLEFAVSRWFLESLCKCLTNFVFKLWVSFSFAVDLMVAIGMIIVVK